MKSKLPITFTVTVVGALLVVAIWHFRQLLGFLLLAILFVFLMNRSTTSDGDHFDGLRFHSTDLSSVDVSLLATRENNTVSPLKLQLPRAAIDFFVTAYPPRGYPTDKRGLQRVPDNIEVTTVRVVLAYPSEEPFTIRSRNQGARAFARSGRDELRTEETIIALTHIPPDWPWEDRIHESQQRLQIIDTYDGLQHALGDTYIGASADDFTQIECQMHATPAYFCKLHMRIAKDLIATVDFSDFRFYGGRSYANERARWVRERVCNFVKPSCS